jgi:hypothetical protein
LKFRSHRDIANNLRMDDDLPCPLADPNSKHFVLLWSSMSVVRQVLVAVSQVLVTALSVLICGTHVIADFVLYVVFI